MELRGGKLARLGTAAGAARARPRPRVRKEARSRTPNPPRRAAQPTRARIQPGRRAPTPKPMRRSPAPRPPRRPVFVPFVRRTTRTASRVTREQLKRHQSRRRQRRAKQRSWRPRPGTTHRRLIALLAALVLVFLAVGARLVDLQAIGRDRYAQLGLDQRVRTVELAAERGSVFDRNGHDIAASVPQQTVWANPRVVTNPAAYAAQLAPIVGGDEAVLRDRLSRRHKGFVYIARKVDNATALKVKALGLAGVDLVPESKRFYPAGDLA